MRSFLASYFSARTRNALCVGLVSALVVQVFLWMGWLKGLERGALDTLFRLRAPRYPSSKIVLVVVDEDTVRRLRQRWPLPRRVYADAVGRLVRAGAKTIAFDVLFSTPSTPEDDRLLVESMRNSRRVVNAVAFNVNAAYNPMLPTDARLTIRDLPPRFTLTDDGARVRDSDWATTPFKELLQSSAGAGHINIHPETDGAVRRIPFVIRYYDELYPSLALASAAHFLEIPLRDVVARPDGLHIADRKIPLDDNGEAWINWTGANNTFPTYSMSQVLDDRRFSNLLDEGVFKDRIVLVGVTALGSFEHRSTPFSPVQPSVEIQANALDNLLQNQPLRQASPLTTWCLLLIFPTIVAVLVAPRGALGGTVSVVLLGLLIWMLAAYLMSRDFYLPVGAPLLAAALTFMAVTTLNYRREWETNWRTDAAIAAIARGGALMASGRDRYRLENVICETARDALNVRHVFLLLQASAPASSLNELLQIVQDEQAAVLWPPVEKLDHDVQARLAGLVQKICAELRDEASSTASPTHICSLLAVPLLGTTDRSTPGLAGCYGALVAIEHATTSRELRAFTGRDAVLLQTLAEQASLAFENLNYYEQLRGRVASADKELQDAYNLLVDQSTKFIAAVESIDNALIITDEAQRAVFVNATCERVLGKATPSLGEVVPEKLSRFKLPEIACLFKNTQASNGEKVSCEVSTVAAYGYEDALDAENGRRSLHAQLTPLGTSDKQVLGALLVVADVTTQRELDRMKTDFVAFVAHELRNPLGSILGYASLMEMAGDQLPVEQRGEMASAISRQCHRLNRMISDLLDVARLDAGRPLELRPTPFDLASLCEKVLESQRATLPVGQPLTLSVKHGEEPVLIEADADRIEQVVTNLVSNAIKYSPDGGNVTIAVALKASDAVLQVSDTGMGMTQEQVGHLFQKFYRTPDSQARGIKGTGLGLYLVKQLVEAHGGHISVTSAPGRGTTFTVTLPQSTPAHALALNGNSSL